MRFVCVCVDFLLTQYEGGQIAKTLAHQNAVLRFAVLRSCVLLRLYNWLSLRYFWQECFAGIVWACTTSLSFPKCSFMGLGGAQACSKRHMKARQTE